MGEENSGCIPPVSEKESNKYTVASAAEAQPLIPSLSLPSPKGMAEKLPLLGRTAPDVPVGGAPGSKPVANVEAVEEKLKSKIAVEQKAKWNTHNLGLRMGADALAAGSAGVLVAPVITMIDRAIIENASGRNTLGASMKASALELLFRPHRFLASKPFALIFSLYFGTYLTANTLDTASSTLKSTPASTTTSGTPKFLATSSANLALCLYKDNRFTQLFGSATSKKPVPLPTFALFTVRDCLTIFASFNLPPVIAPKLEAHMGEEMKKWMSGASAAQFITPAAVQLVSTPLHLLGLDLYNRSGVSASERAARVVRDWGMSSLARMGRIVPAFGVGGVVNAKVRKNMQTKLES